jgi:predicted CoA-binding protein
MSKINELAVGFLSQKNIAVAGVSRKNGGVGNIIYKKLKETGHNVYPVNPNMDTFEGARCYADVKSIPDKIDGVVIVTKPSVAETIVQDCIGSGVKSVWMHNMFGHKGANKAGSSISGKAVQLCRENNITVIPGGCPLMFCEPVDFGHKFLRGINKITGGFRV